MSDECIWGRTDMKKIDLQTIEEYRRRIRSEQSSKNHLRRDRDTYRDLYRDAVLENKALREQIENETNRDWSPVWLKEKLIQAQEENARLKKYIMALEEKKEYDGGFKK